MELSRICKEVPRWPPNQCLIHLKALQRGEYKHLETRFSLSWIRVMDFVFFFLFFSLFVHSFFLKNFLFTLSFFYFLLLFFFFFLSFVFFSFFSFQQATRRWNEKNKGTFVKQNTNPQHLFETHSPKNWKVPFLPKV